MPSRTPSSRLLKNSQVRLVYRAELGFRVLVGEMKGNLAASVPPDFPVLLATLSSGCTFGEKLGYSDQIFGDGGKRKDGFGLWPAANLDASDNYHSMVVLD